EMLNQPIALGHYCVEAVERRVWRPNDTRELYITFVGIERDQQHVVHGRQRPDQQHDTEYHRDRFSENSPQPIARPAHRPAGWVGDAGATVAAHVRASARKGPVLALHNCTSLVWSVRIRMSVIGISTGRADSTTATPSAGWAASKA